MTPEIWGVTLGPEPDPNEGGHVALRGPHIQLKPSWDKRGIKAKRAHISNWFMREIEEKRERGDLSFLPRSTEFRGSVFVGPRAKVHHIDERYAWVPEKRDFVDDPR